jgi:histidine phosphotransferase ChpT
MPALVDIRLLELISARMCHDLISPVSAIGNGVELVTEFDDGMQGEALGLIGESAAVASRLLQFYRAAFGSARSADGSPLGLAEARQRTIECFGGGRIVIDWPGDVDLGGKVLSRPGIKLLLNLMLAAHDMLPGSGRISVRFSKLADGLETEVALLKEGFRLGEAFRQAFDGERDGTDGLTPRTVVAHLCRKLADGEGIPLDIRDMQDGLSLKVRLGWA